MSQKKNLILLIIFCCLTGCDKDETSLENIQLVNVYIGSVELNKEGEITNNLPIDRSIILNFSKPVNTSTVEQALILRNENGSTEKSLNFLYEDKTIVIIPGDLLEPNSTYILEITDQLKGAKGEDFDGLQMEFKTAIADLKLLSFLVEGSDIGRNNLIQNVPVNLNVTLNFSSAVNAEEIEDAIVLNGSGSTGLVFSFSDNNKTINIASANSLQYLTRYDFNLSEAAIGASGEHFTGFSKTFYTAIDSTYKFPAISDEDLLTKVQEQTFKYFWDFGHPNSGLARERNTSGNLVTIGGSGFGVMAIIVGIERGFITRQEGVDRLEKIVNFLTTADRFHGVWPHWLNGNTGDVIPFSANDNGGDLVETAFMIQGLLTVREYLNNTNPQEAAIKNTITTLWEEVEWDWYTRDGQNVLYWHWSPDKGWTMNHKISGWNEALIIYVLAASSPSHPIDASVYHAGWSRNGAMQNGNTYYGVELPLGNAYGGPLFFAHYSFLGLDPRNLDDQYANYWEQNVNHSLINQKHAEANPYNFVGYGEKAWGFTASDNHVGYNAHSPTNDKGVITPTAALSSFPYTPEQSMDALHHFYYLMGDKLWGQYGFIDAYNPTEQWYADSYLAIDQGPIIIMIENHRTGLLWDLFMDNPEIGAGLTKLGFTYE